MKLVFKSLAMSSTSQKPALWRVFAYSLPGLPRPTINLMGAVMVPLESKSPTHAKAEVGLL
jgi:hypothetical protein